MKKKCPTLEVAKYEMFLHSKKKLDKLQNTRDRFRLTRNGFLISTVSIFIVKSRKIQRN